MAKCSFLTATDASNLSLNNSIVWGEICEIQTAILAAISNNECSTIVADGTPMTFLSGIDTATLTAGGSGYSIDTATATINANGTGGTGAVVSLSVPSTGIISNSDFTVTNGGSGYTPVSATASVGVLYDVRDDLLGAGLGQDETHWDNSPTTEGTFAGGDDYVVGEVITLTESSTVTVDAISATGVVTTVGQTQADFDDNIDATENGKFNGGTGYIDNEIITLNDGTVLDNVVTAGGVVTQFEIISSSTVSFAADTTLVQASSDGEGTGFTLTLDGNNETSVGVVTQFSLSSAGAVPYRYPASITQDTTTGIGVGFTLVPDTDNVQPVTTGSGAILTPIVTNGVITSVVINNGGSLYLGQEPIVFSHPSGTNASAYVSAVDGTGAVTGITLVNGGTGYETASATITINHSTGFGFEGTVQTSGGVVTGITVQNGGAQYGDVYPYITVNDATGRGAEINVTSVAAGAITSIQLADGGYNYSSPSVLIFNYDGTANNTATIDLILETDTFNNPNDPVDYYMVLEGQATNCQVARQLQYVLDYFTALGYNIRAQVNPATNNTIQWQVIWSS